MVENGQDYDAVVAMTALDNAPVFAVYIQMQQSYTVKGIRDGTYRVYFSQGEDWDSALAKFTRNARLVRFQDTFPYVTTATQYRIWRITLYKVAGGTGTTETLGPAQFPDLK